MDDKIIISKRIKEAIKNSHISQKKIADVLGIRDSNITNWKKGENLPSIEVLRRLCLILDEDANYILGLDINNESKIEIHNSFNNNSGNINFR